MALTGAVSVLDLSGAISRVLANAYAISGSAALLLTFVEPFLRWRCDMPAAEKRFRYGFTAVYSLL